MVAVPATAALDAYLVALYGSEVIFGDATGANATVAGFHNVKQGGKAVFCLRPFRRRAECCRHR